MLSNAQNVVYKIRFCLGSLKQSKILPQKMHEKWIACIKPMNNLGFIHFRARDELNDVRKCPYNGAVLNS